MAGQSFRFLQAGSFQLQASLQGLTYAPDHLAEMIANLALIDPDNLSQASI